MASSTDQIIANLHGIVRRNGRLGIVTPITRELNLRDDLGLKDLDLLQVVMDVEDAYEGVVYFSDEEAEGLRTVGDLEALTLRKIANPEEQAA